MLFSLALLTIIECGFQLYTGRIGYAFEYRHSPYAYLKMFIGNIAGTFVAILWNLLQNDDMQELFTVLSDTRFSKSYGYMLFSGFMCGILMMIAVHCKNKLITVFCIMTFILCGFDHCIADFPYFLFAYHVPFYKLVIKMLLVIFGNSLGAIYTNALIHAKICV
jgi:formate/nitrite transporter FocA (FNT family)